MPYPERLHHTMPGWVKDGEAFHVRVRAEQGAEIIGTAGAKARAVIEAARHYHEHHRWFCRLILVMPDHLHAIVAFPCDVQMSAVLGSWKSFLAKSHKIEWQDGFFDHRLRSRKEANESWHYIRQNPVRAGLAKTEDDWSWVWWPGDSTAPEEAP
jgi:putative transposase